MGSFPYTFSFNFDDAQIVTPPIGTFAITLYAPVLELIVIPAALARWCASIMGEPQ